MKRLTFLLVFAAALASASAQPPAIPNFDPLNTDTLEIGDREPTFYYWDSNWFYRFGLNDSIAWTGFGDADIEGGRCEKARYLWTDSSLRVIGVAAAVSFSTYSQGGMGDPDWKDAAAEYLRLYELDSATGDMVMLAEKSWNNIVPRYMINTKYFPGQYTDVQKKYCPVYEVYFDSAFTVRDSFYVSMTFNNISTEMPFWSYKKYYLVGWPNSYAKLYAGGTSYVNTDLFAPNPCHIRARLTKPGATDPRNCIYDTNWHIIVKNYCQIQYAIPDQPPHDLNTYYYIFPIIDTSGDNSWMPECERPENLGIVYLSQECAVLTWNGGYNSSVWELSVVPRGLPPDTANLILCVNDVAPVTGLDTATWYTARVRSVCNRTHISEWSDSIVFFVPGDTSSHDPLSVSSTADRFSYVMPNPASESVTVASSFLIDEVDIYTLSGQCVASRKVGGISTSIDISSLPSGTYIIRIATIRGVAHKKLVVKR